jgi:hypothetical protein
VDGLIREIHEKSPGVRDKLYSMVKARSARS